jgi:hypothetical protein
MRGYSSQRSGGWSAKAPGVFGDNGQVVRTEELLQMWYVCFVSQKTPALRKNAS